MSTPRYTIQIDGDDGVRDVVERMDPPPLGAEFTLFGHAEHPQGLRLRVVRVAKPANTHAGAWVCEACALLTQCAYNSSALCRSGGNHALARPEDVPVLTVKGILA